MKFKLTEKVGIFEEKKKQNKKTKVCPLIRSYCITYDLAKLNYLHPKPFSFLSEWVFSSDEFVGRSRYS